MTEIPEERRIALIEYIAHLTAKDWEATVADLVTLGFIPQDVVDDKAKLNIVAPILGSVLEQLSNGGGAKAVNVEEIGDQVEELSNQYPILLPSYFGLVSLSLHCMHAHAFSSREMVMWCGFLCSALLFLLFFWICLPLFTHTDYSYILSFRRSWIIFR